MRLNFADSSGRSDQSHTLSESDWANSKIGGSMFLVPSWESNVVALIP